MYGLNIGKYFQNPVLLVLVVPTLLIWLLLFVLPFPDGMFAPADDDDDDDDGTGGGKLCVAPVTVAWISLTSPETRRRDIIPGAAYIEANGFSVDDLRLSSVAGVGLADAPAAVDGVCREDGGVVEKTAASMSISSRIGPSPSPARTSEHIARCHGGRFFKDARHERGRAEKLRFFLPKKYECKGSVGIRYMYVTQHLCNIERKICELQDMRCRNLVHAPCASHRRVFYDSN